MVRILLVDDEREIRENLCDILNRKGYAVDDAGNQEKALELLEDESRRYDLALLDVYLQGNSLSYTIGRAANERKIPVVYMTARDDQETASFCLSKADDYVQKDRTVELLSRVRKTLEKTGSLSTELKAGELRIDTEKALAYKNEQPLDLTKLQYHLLRYFMSRQGKFISRDELKRAVWSMTGGFIDGVSDDTVRARIKDLRKVIEDDPQNPRYIQTVHGMGGYKFSE